ncbi:alpha-ketoglutarate-dependent dioxygenase AlkB [Synechococcus sp. HK05]|uniref:alpha-ketoglutarate-dependent dioxygenase AlkB family protein n=1 Tax=Synechococcus sp. HK05 TaxID=2725975 RepID=UPI001C3957B0|nr:alpha-ketoglutarate-dependent dioxygenase AlkB [Synechococcus sp. HK05]MBV2350399.1 alpha-ketoglutarate-dependent dioxygenase AlkB [Synechococcus sp. HK05]
MIRIERTGLQLRHGVAWLQQQGLQTPQLRQALGQSLAWEQPLVTVYGKQHRTPRLTCWVADPGCSYRYSGLQQAIHPWTAELETLRQLLLDQLGVRFNSLLLNRYRDGADRMGWHADDEPELDDQAPIVSLSLGAARDLRFRPRRGDAAPFAINLADGDLLVMDPPSQRHWQHALPPRARVQQERINLTFRVIRPA